MSIDRTKSPEKFEFSAPNLYPVKVYRLSNGIPLYVLQQDDYALLRMDIRVKAGSSFQDRPGVALSTAKMLQEGSLSHRGKLWTESVDYEGAFVDINTTMDFSSFSLHFPQKSSSKILPLVKEIFEEPLFSEESMDNLKIQQKQQLSINLEKNSYVAFCSFSSAVYGQNSPYGRFLKLDDIDNWNTDLSKVFFRKHYVPSAMRIFIAGNVTKGLIKEIENSLGKLENSEYLGKFPDFKKCKPEKSLKIVNRNGLQSSICIGKELFNCKHPAWMKMSILNRILGGYFGSRLMTEIRENSGLAYGIYSRLLSRQHSGLFYISADVNSEAAEEAVDKIKREVKRLSEEIISEDELKRVKNYEFGSRLRNFDGLFNIMERYMEINDYELNNDFWREFFELIANVSAIELCSMARTYLDLETLTEVTVK